MRSRYVHLGRIAAVAIVLAVVGVVKPASALGALSFGAATNYSVGSDPTNVAVADLNGDGAPDIVTVTADPSGDFADVSVMLNNGDGTYKSPVTYPIPKVEDDSAIGIGGLAVADLGNGHMDVVVLGWDSSMDAATAAVLLGNGDGTFGAPTYYELGSSWVPYGLAVADLGNGHPDIIAGQMTADGGGMFVLLGNGDGTFQSPVWYSCGTDCEPDAVAVGDFNGDGKPDLAVADSEGSGVEILLGNGDGTFGSPAYYSTGEYPTSIAVGDFNGDGKEDLAVTNAASGSDSTVSVLLGNGDGTFQAANNISVPPYPTDVVVGNFNGDGAQDLAVVNGDTSGFPWGYYGASTTVSVLLGNGDGTFRSASNYDLGEGPAWVAADDLNGDGKQDLAVADYTSGQVSTLLNTSNGPATSVSVAVSPFSIVADGLSQTQVTATVTDAGGNPVDGDAVAFSADDPGIEFGPVTDDGDGVYTATVTSSTTVHNVTITATDSSISPNVSGTAVLDQTVGAPTGISVSLAPAAIKANGTATTTATATVTDAEGHPISGQSVSFVSSDADEEVGAVTDNGDGTYSATVTGSDAIEHATITATDDSTNPELSDSATLEQIGSATSVEVALSPPAIAATGVATTTATATVTDAIGDPVSTDSIAFSSSDSGESIGAVTNNGNGTYSAVITSSTTIGTPTVTATDESVSPSVSGSATLDQVVGPAADVSVSLSPASVLANGMSTTVATATVTDSAGHRVDDDQVAFTPSDAGDSIGVVTSHGNGTYTATITSSTSVHNVTVTATDSSVSPAVTGTSTLAQTVGPATAIAVSLSPASIVANGSATSTATATVTDAAGHPLSTDSIQFSSSDPGESIGAVTNNGNGTYSAVIASSTTAEASTVTATDESVSPTVSGHTTLTETAGKATAVSVSLSPSTIVASGTSETTATAAVRDVNGNAVTDDNVRFSSSDSGESIGAVTNNGNGTYSAVITSSTTIGTPTVTATDESVSPSVSGSATLDQVVGPAADVSVSLSPASVLANGMSTTVATATVTDSAGHRVDDDQVAFTPSDAGDSIGVVTSHGNGTYTATITSSTSVHNVTVTATDSSVSPAVTGTSTLAQTVGPATAIAVSLSPASIVANGSATSTATATVTDAAGHPVDGQSVTFTSTDPVDLIGSVTNSANGTYTTLITGSTTIGAATITATDESTTPTLTSQARLIQTAPVSTTPPPSQPAPINTAPPTIKGTAQLGDTLTIVQGMWTNGPTAYSYQWESCDAAGGDCAPISGATKTTYALAKADVGNTVRVAETASNPYGVAVAVSAAIGPIVPTVPTIAQIKTLVEQIVTSASKIAAVRQLSKHGAYSTAVMAPGSGKLVLDWYYKHGKARSLIADASATFGAAGKHSVRIRLTKAGRRLLKSEAKLHVTAAVRFTPTHGRATTLSRNYVWK